MIILIQNWTVRSLTALKEMAVITVSLKIPFSILKAAVREGTGTGTDPGRRTLMACIT